jgi:hypothetical protein
MTSVWSTDHYLGEVVLLRIQGFNRLVIFDGKKHFDGTANVLNQLRHRHLLEIGPLLLQLGISKQ